MICFSTYLRSYIDGMPVPIRNQENNPFLYNVASLAKRVGYWSIESPSLHLQLFDMVPYLGQLLEKFCNESHI